ncbi:hypothetical protein L6452_00071 [Arctium lappa]|uniref:Uncharacterized protein n=1 Tax=Arctium lappa TaxID=4217 RepID=A0ACB9FCU7_ARCLA|nr:hypothetical protein L6452_00071 [Arctium lappa]
MQFIDFCFIDTVISKTLKSILPSLQLVFRAGIFKFVSSNLLSKVFLKGLRVQVERSKFVNGATYKQVSFRS